MKNESKNTVPGAGKVGLIGLVRLVGLVGLVGRVGRWHGRLWKTANIDRNWDEIGRWKVDLSDRVRVETAHGLVFLAQVDGWEAVVIEIVTRTRKLLESNWLQSIIRVSPS